MRWGPSENPSFQISKKMNFQIPENVKFLDFEKYWIFRFRENEFRIP